MKKNLFIILLLLAGISVWSCTTKNAKDSSETGVSEKGKLKETLAGVYQEINTAGYGLDSAWIIADKVSGDKILKLYGSKTSSGSVESVTSYIQIEPDGIGSYVPLYEGPQGAVVISCASLNCGACQLNNPWADDAFCDCTKTSDPDGPAPECNMHEYRGRLTFKIAAAADGLIYPAEKSDM